MSPAGTKHQLDICLLALFLLIRAALFPLTVSLLFLSAAKYSIINFSLEMISLGFSAVGAVLLSAVLCIPLNDNYRDSRKYLDAVEKKSWPAGRKNIFKREKHRTPLAAQRVSCKWPPGTKPTPPRKLFLRGTL